MSAADEDTELRDLLIHTLENNGVLNKIKAELRASVFLALEEQERPENKPTLVNERLLHFLNSREGRLVAGLVTDFLQHFHLDFTLAVLQPEANLTSTADDRAHVAEELGLPEAEKGGPLLLELIKRFRHREAPLNGVPEQGLPSGHMAEAQAKFELYDRDKNGEISKGELRELFVDLFPHFHRDMLDRYVNDEFTSADRDFSSGIDQKEFLAMYRRLFIQGRSVVVQEVSDLIHPSSKLQLHTRTDNSFSMMSPDNHPAGSFLKPQPKLDDHQLSYEEYEDHKLDEDDPHEDSFFDDPIPKPEKIYGWKEEASKPNGSLSALLNSRADRSEPNSHSEAPNIIEGSLHSSFRDLRSASEKMASLELGGGNEDEYADDFNSTSQRSDKSEVSIGEDLEEELSVDDLTGSDNKLEDFTLDNSISHISDVADYLEEVS
ncbi:PREDICTED: FGFR1 oncogene partner [Nanorana parkeri]|uniref:FGFR1 oncogene partner n=1 Tax=Nanorana parkeri TaxID=125878 RepID=UPI000854F9B2|nr:PREDICTED: FGFR1 oncogene partner [Nanorana parkeri]